MMSEGDSITVASLTDGLSELAALLVGPRVIPERSITRQHLDVARHGTTLSSNEGPITRKPKRFTSTSVNISGVAWTDVFTATYGSGDLTLSNGHSVEMFARTRIAVDTFTAAPPNNVPDDVRIRIVIEGTASSGGTAYAYVPSADGYSHGLTVIEYNVAGSEAAWQIWKDNVVAVIDRILIHSEDSDTVFDKQGTVEVATIKLQARMTSVNHSVILHNPILGLMHGK